MIVLACGISTPGLAQFQEVWRARYDGAAGYAHDRAASFAIDGAGNVYVTGQSNGTNRTDDVATVKFGPNGEQLWVARYGSDTMDSERGSQILLDAQTNVYVLGSRSSLNGFPDILLLKHDPDGHVLWSAIYDSPEHSADGPGQMLLDGAGHIYVTGYSYSGDSRHALTLKYDGDGSLLWADRYESLATCGSGSQIRFDASGNLRVSFRPCSSALAVVKYDTDGHQLALILHASNPPLWPSAWVVGQDGSVIFCGSAGGWATVKFDELGNQLWLAVSKLPSDYLPFLNGEAPQAIRTDSAGNVFVNGTSYTSPCAPECYERDFFTVQYDEQGRNRWMARYSSGLFGFGETASGITSEDGGKSFAVGIWNTTIDATHAVVQYDSSGNAVWSASLNTRNYTGPVATALDRAGNLVAMATALGNGEDYLVVKFAPTNFPNLPRIVTAPVSQALPLGGDTLLNVSATGPEPLAYQWLKNGLPVRNGTNSSLLLTNAQPTRLADYMVRVSNAYGSLLSPSARVSLAPLLSAVAVGPDSRMRFTVSGEVNDYTIEVSPDLAAWTTVTNFFGAGLEFTNSSSGQTHAFYRVSRQP